MPWIGTKEVTSYSFMYEERLRVELLDMPGFYDTYESDTKVLEKITSWLSEAYKRKIQLCGIIHLHRISDYKGRGLARRNLVVFQKLCGPGCFPNITLATTFWDTIEPGIGAARERELIEKEGLWGPMHSVAA